MKTIKIDFTDVKSVENAKRVKARLENEGLSLVKTEQLGLDVWRLLYE